jgi:hypothetical protein
VLFSGWESVKETPTSGDGTGTSILITAGEVVDKV